MAVSDRQYKLAQDCIKYLEKQIKNTEEKLNRAHDKHEIEGVMNGRTIDKYEHELDIFNALLEPQKKIVWRWTDENRPEFSEEYLREQWERDNGRSVDE